MRAGEKVAMLRKIAEIRELQRVAAEAETMRAVRMLEETKAVHNECINASQAAEAGWLNSLSAPQQEELSRLWSALLVREGQAVVSASSDLDEATNARDRRASDWRTAVGRKDLAERMARNAFRALARAREEDSLHEATDRHLNKRRAS